MTNDHRDPNAPAYRPPSPVIDVWAQHPNRRFLEQPFFETIRRWVGLEAREIALEETIAAMRSAGIERALLSAWHGPEGALITNEEVHAACRQAPDLFVGLAAVDVRDPVRAVATLRRAVEEYGFKGLRIVQWLWERAPTHALFYPLYATCVELDVPVCLQVGLTGPLRTSETGRPLHIEQLALDFPELRIVCGHIGAPWHLEMIALATKFPNVYIDTSAYKPRRYPRELVTYMNGHGRRKVLFGTNYPMLSPAACLAELATLELERETLQAFLYDNATAVFRLDRNP